MGDLAESGDLGEVAIDYARRRWPVFPVEPQGKRPLGRLVPHGLKDASTDETVIAAWWQAEPKANIGLVSGIHFDVLDVDAGFAGFAALDAAKPPGAPDFDGPVCTTGKGHHVYLAPTGIGNKASFLPGIDWRGRGGYVVAPPSIHPSGARYEWLLPGESERELKAVPAWLLELLEPPRADFASIERRLSRPSTPGTAYGQAALVAEVARVLSAPEGCRNDTVNRAAHALGSLVAGGVLGLETVILALEDAAQRVGLEMSEARPTIKSGLAAGMRSPRGVPR